MPIHTVYGLLIAIDKYPAGIRSLNGCINDQRAFRDYLTRQCNTNQFDLKILELKNETATRSAIIKGFEHFKQAINDDVCVFYFSGHGSRIPAPQFWEVFSGMNETILCADSKVDDGSNDLANKELSWLIHQVVGGKRLHFLAVMDCCYSGNNTRNYDLAGIRQVQSRQSPRPLEAYEGYKHYISNGHGKWSVPKAPHISFGACRPDQTAKEINIGGTIRGAFTASLIEALETTHELLSYADLESRVAQKISARTFDQFPLLDPVAGADTNISFLGRAITTKRKYFIAWNQQENHWELNAGQLQGISARPGSFKLALENSFRELFVSGIMLDRSIISGMDGLDKLVQHEAILLQNNITTRFISILPVNNRDSITMLEKSYHAHKHCYATLVDDPADAEFFVSLINGKYAFYYAGSDKPLFYPVNADEGEAAASIFWKKVESVLRWQYLLNLENLVSGIHKHEFEMELWHSEGKNWQSFETYVPVMDWKSPPSYSWTVADNRLLAPGYALRIHNRSTRALYFSALHFNGRYGIDNQYLPGQKLLPGQEAWLTWTDVQGVTHKGIGLTIEERHWRAGISEMTDYLKIFITEKEFSTHDLNQQALDLIYIPKERTFNIKDALCEVNELGRIIETAWTSQNIRLHIVKPLPTEP